MAWQADTDPQVYRTGTLRWEGTLVGGGDSSRNLTSALYFADGYNSDSIASSMAPLGDLILTGSSDALVVRAVVTSDYEIEDV